MPQVRFICKKGVRWLINGDFANFFDAVQEIVSQEMSCEEFKCPKEEIERIQDDNIHRFEKRDLGIMIIANEIPERKSNLQDRAWRIKNRIRKYLQTETRFYVWVLLCPAAFAETA